MTKNKGSITLEESLSCLVREGHLELEEALEVAVHPDDLKSLFRSTG
jgi:Tfp pilus assembly pilus retraction ATPase PilT